MNKETYKALKAILYWFDECVEKRKGNGWVFKDIEKIKRWIAKAEKNIK